MNAKIADDGYFNVFVIHNMNKNIADNGNFTDFTIFRIKDTLPILQFLRLKILQTDTLHILQFLRIKILQMTDILSILQQFR